jgi:hypothetical protein
MKTKLIFTLTIIILVSCKKPSIKSDPQNPDLPSYSEQGLNVGGILINDSAWLTLKPGLFSTSKPVYLVSYPNGDSIVILLNGNFKDSGLQNQNVRTIYIVIKEINIISDSDLLKLNDKTFILDGNTNYGGFSNYDGSAKVGKSTGNISFGRVSVMTSITYGDGSANNPVLHPYIFAGKLNMNFSTTRIFSLTNGRFDMTLLRNSNFGIY